MRAIVAQRISGFYKILTNTIWLLRSKSVPHTFSSPSLKGNVGILDTSGCWMTPHFDLYTAQTAVTNTHIYTHSTYNRTQRKWTCSAVLTPHREGKQNDRFGQKRKERHRRGWRVRLNRRWLQDYYSLVNRKLRLKTEMIQLKWKVKPSQKLDIKTKVKRGGERKVNDVCFKLRSCKLYHVLILFCSVRWVVFIIIHFSCVKFRFI